MIAVRDVAPAPRTDARALWLLVAVVSAIVYAATANRGPQWQDSGWQQWRIVTGTLEHAEGLALTHPLHFWIGRAALKLLPMLEPAFAVTLVSSICGAVAIANLAALLLLLTRNAAASLICATALLLSHTFWQHATHTESYGLVLALLSAEWLCLARFCITGRSSWLLLMALANGLGVANHMLAALSTPVIVVIFASLFHVKQICGSVCAKAIGLWVLGSLPYVSYVIWTGVQSGDPGGAVHSALFGTYAPRVLNAAPSPRMLAMTVAFFVYNFPGMTLPLALHAMIGKTDAPALLWRAMWAWLLIYFAFAVRYTVADQYSFLFPAYAALVVFAGLGLADILKRPSAFSRWVVTAAAVTAGWTPVVYWWASRFAESRNVMTQEVGRKPYRDGWREFFVPWGVGQDAAARVNREAYALAGPDGIIYVADSMMEHALLYDQVVGRAPRSTELVMGDHGYESVAQVHERLEKAMRSGRTLVLVPQDREKPDVGVAGARWERRGDLYLLTGLD